MQNFMRLTRDDGKAMVISADHVVAVEEDGDEVIVYTVVKPFRIRGLTVDKILEGLGLPKLPPGPPGLF